MISVSRYLHGLVIANLNFMVNWVIRLAQMNIDNKCKFHSLPLYDEYVALCTRSNGWVWLHTSRITSGQLISFHLNWT